MQLVTGQSEILTQVCDLPPQSQRPPVPQAPRMSEPPLQLHKASAILDTTSPVPHSVPHQSS